MTQNLYTILILDLSKDKILEQKVEGWDKVEDVVKSCDPSKERFIAAYLNGVYIKLKTKYPDLLSRYLASISLKDTPSNTGLEADQ